MKKLTVFSSIFLILISTSISVFYISCKKNTCKDIDCFNGGFCVDGNCNCATGWSGIACDVLIDSCLNVVCFNGGTCVSGLCNCSAGYEGDSCQTEMRTKFIGNYSVSDMCSNSGSTNYYFDISNYDSDVTKIEISNFWNFFTSPVIATVSGNEFAIAFQEPDSNGWKVAGTGSISGDTLFMSYLINDTTAVIDVCAPTCIHQ